MGSEMSDMPTWFLEAFDDAATDLFHDMGSSSVGDVPAVKVERRARQVWYAVVAHQPQTATAVDTQQPVHPYEPATEKPSMRERMGQTLADVQEPGVTAVARLGFPEPAMPQPKRSEALRGYAPGMFVTREAAVQSVPKIDCPECGGNGTREFTNGQGARINIDCPFCDGSGLVAAPVAEPRETGAAPEDSPLVQPPSAEELAQIEAGQAPPDVVAAQVAAAQAGLAKMRQPRH